MNRLPRDSQLAGPNLEAIGNGKLGCTPEKFKARLIEYRDPSYPSVVVVLGLKRRDLDGNISRATLAGVDEIIACLFRFFARAVLAVRKSELSVPRSETAATSRAVLPLGAAYRGQTCESDIKAWTGTGESKARDRELPQDARVDNETADGRREPGIG